VQSPPMTLRCSTIRGMTRDVAAVMQRVCEFVDEHRETALWSLREDYYPETVEEALRVLDAIARRAGVPAYQEAARLREWLSQSSSEPSAAS